MPLIRESDGPRRGGPRRWGGLAVLLAAWSVVPVAAQATYSVFPAKSVDGAAHQPTGHGATARVTLVVQDSTLEYAILALAHQAQLRPVYSNASSAFTKRIAVHIVNANVMNAFSVVLHGTGLTATLAPDSESVVIRSTGSPTTERARVAGGSVAGRVTDSTTGAGLNGAQVRVEGTKLSAVTADSGNFILRNVPPGDQVLQVRLFGYRPVMRTVTVVDGERTTVRVTMASVPTVLSGVVTTATGVQRKIEVGNDITTINVDSVMQVAPISTVTDLLETRVPGLTVVHSSGAPGDPSRLRLRGPGSVQLNNDPIMIVDGVRVYASQSDPRNQNLAHSQALGGTQYNAPSPLDQIDPNSIETIEVLKGPSASAIYGSDAAAGVIVITTKHGRAGPAHWNLALGAGMNWLPGPWPTSTYKLGLSNVGDGAGHLCYWYDLSCRVDSVVTFQALSDPRYTVFSHGSDQTAALTVSGGNQTLLYSLTGSGSGDLGNLKLPASEQARYDSLYGRSYGPIPNALVRPDHYNTWGVDGAATAHASSTLSVTVQSSLFNSTQQHSSLENAINQLQGEYISPVFGTIGNGGTVSPVGAPLIASEFERATDDQVSTTNALTLRWQPAVWLPLTATAGVNTAQRHDVTYVPFGIYDGSYALTGQPVSIFAGDTTGSYGLGRGSSQDQTLTAGTTMPLFRQRVNLAVGANLHAGSTADFSIYTNQLAPGVSVPTTFTTPCPSGTEVCYSPGTQATSHQSTYGWYVQPTFNVGNRFFTSPGFRLDGGNGAATSAGSIGGLSGFPKMDFSYVAVDRQGDRPLWGFLTLLRPRLAFGLAGTQPGPADKLRLYNVGSYNLTVPGQGGLTSGNGGLCGTTVLVAGSTPSPAVCLDYLGNTQLRPERSSELEGGVDATLWQNRLSVTYTQYNKTRHDAILAVPVASSVFGDGVQIQKNIGEIRNTGTELTANAIVLESRTLSWNVGMNLSNDNNLVVRLNKGQSPIVTYQQTAAGTNAPSLFQTRVQAGYPLDAVFTRPIVGFADANGNGVIDPSEIVYGDSAVYVGQPNAKYQFNLTSDVTLLNGHLGVHATFAYQNGMTQINTGACTSGVLQSLMNQSGVSYETQAAVVATNCNRGISSYTMATTASVIGLAQAVNTFRFNDLSINYILPSAMAQWFRVPRMSVVLQGSNLALHTNYRGLDPNVNAFSTVSAGDQTVDNGQIPAPRTWWLKLTLGN